MCTFCPNCGADLRTQEPVELPIKRAYIEVGDYDPDDGTYAFETEMVLGTCTKCHALFTATLSDAGLDVEDLRRMAGETADEDDD